MMQARTNVVRTAVALVALALAGATLGACAGAARPQVEGREPTLLEWVLALLQLEEHAEPDGAVDKGEGAEGQSGPLPPMARPDIRTPTDVE